MNQKGRSIKSAGFATRTPSYPLKGFMAFAWIKNSDYQACYPLDVVHGSLPEIYAHVEEFEKELTGDVVMDEALVIVPMNLRNLYPLEARFWQKPRVHYDSADRVRLFMETLEHYPWYQVVVIPTVYGDSSYFSAVVPAPITGGNTSIETFMLLSDYPVDEELSCAGIYTLEKPFAVNWKTREVTREPPPSISKIHN